MGEKGRIARVACGSDIKEARACQDQIQKRQGLAKTTLRFSSIRYLQWREFEEPLSEVFAIEEPVSEVFAMEQYTFGSHTWCYKLHPIEQCLSCSGAWQTGKCRI